jgi:hypothetical protein
LLARELESRAFREGVKWGENADFWATTEKIADNIVAFARAKGYVPGDEHADEIIEIARF